MLEPGLLDALNPWWRGESHFDAQLPRRDLQPRLLERLVGLDDRRALVVVGARQIGKSVILRQLAHDLTSRGWPRRNVVYFDFSDDRILDAVSAAAVEKATAPTATKERERIFLLDEISQSGGGAWPRWLKRVVDERIGRFVVTDSSAAILRDRGRESGLGRWDEIQLETLSFSEARRIWQLDSDARTSQGRDPLAMYLAVGGFPEHLVNASRRLDEGGFRERLRVDIADKAILRDLAGANVDIARAKDLFVYLVQQSGSVFDATARARDFGVDRRSVASWLISLLDSALVKQLPSHHARASARLRSKPKIFAADHGLVLAFAPTPNPSADAEVRGRVVEAVVYRHLRDVARQYNARLEFFRKSEDLEIDFVLETKHARMAIEVTSSDSARSRKRQRLAIATRAADAERSLLIHGGEVNAESGEISLREFLTSPERVLQEENA